MNKMLVKPPTPEQIYELMTKMNRRCGGHDVLTYIMSTTRASKNYQSIYGGSPGMLGVRSVIWRPCGGPPEGLKGQRGGFQRRVRLTKASEGKRSVQDSPGFSWLTLLTSTSAAHVGERGSAILLITSWRYPCRTDFWSEAALRQLGGLTMIDISGEEWQIDSGGIASPKVNDD